MSVDVAVEIAALLGARGETLAVAESATGGLILSLLTDVAGASAWLRGGVVAYTNDVKRDLVGVAAETLTEHGAVSAETARSMALGARRLFGATWALGETGVAGPQSGRRSTKPAGLTFIAVAGPSTDLVERVLLSSPGDRQAVKSGFAMASLELLLKNLRP